MKLYNDKCIHWIRLEQAFAEAQMSKCVKAKVGCILVDKDGRIKGSGYNGTRSGVSNCRDVFPDYTKEIDRLTSLLNELNKDYDNSSRSVRKVVGDHIIETNDAINKLRSEHREWSERNEIHAEVNMLLTTNRNDREGGILYVTHRPCKRCAPVIAASGIKKVYYSIGGLTNDSDDSIFGDVKLIQYEGVNEQ